MLPELGYLIVGAFFAAALVEMYLEKKSDESFRAGYKRGLEDGKRVRVELR